MEKQTLINICTVSLIIALVGFITYSELGTKSYCIEWKADEGIVTRSGLEHINGPLLDDKNNTYIFKLDANTSILQETVYDVNHNLVKDLLLKCNTYLKTK